MFGKCPHMSYELSGVASQQSGHSHIRSCAL
jgi:hypothetical protein